MTTRQRLLLFCSAVVLLFATYAPAQQGKPQAYTMSIPATDASGNVITPAQAAANSTFATFPYTVVSSRDGNTYSGVMVGQSPFGGNLSTTVIDVPIIPVIVTTNAIATKVTPTGTAITTEKGTTVFDPTAVDPCLSYPNNVPLTVVEESPIFQPTTFKFGSTTIGSTQYIDAFQRANFWKFAAGTNYHIMLNPQIYAPVSLNIPGDQGYAIPASLYGGCAPEGVVNIDYMFQHIFSSLLASEGVNASQFPIFLLQNTVLALPSYKGFFIFGFHAAIVDGPHIQTYSYVNFQTTNFFGPAFLDTVAVSHEIGEWMDDPFVGNPTPAWGHVGQVGGCQANLEVGDPLTGTNVGTVTGTNGFAYHLQELAFFSWFYGAPSISANGWFSDNNTFTTDAGSVCTKH